MISISHLRSKFSLSISEAKFTIRMIAKGVTPAEAARRVRADTVSGARLMRRTKVMQEHWISRDEYNKAEAISAREGISISCAVAMVKKEREA